MRPWACATRPCPWAIGLWDSWPDLWRPWGMLLWSRLFRMLCAEPQVGSVFRQAQSVLDTPRKPVLSYNRAGLRHWLTFSIDSRHVLCNIGLLCYNTQIKWTWSSFLFSNSPYHLQRSTHKSGWSYTPWAWVPKLFTCSLSFYKLVLWQGL